MQNCVHLTESNLIPSIQGKFVYKDQCTRCFIDYNDPSGIDLCLKCLNGSCRISKNHSNQHFQQTSHPIVLTFYNTIKPKQQTEQKEITKLAIGKEGGADFANENEYEIKTELRCLICQITLDSSKINGLVESVIKAETSFAKSGLVAWELEIKPCAHTKHISQVPAKELSNNILGKCSDCNLSGNLWLCLICGNLGCGRSNYDGTGGNGHALEHYKKSSHEIVVKMGTITPDGNASVHCYVCDEEVQDDKLADHLRNYGIKVENQQKTEKSVLEMNLSLNLNLSLSKSVEEGRKLTPVFGKCLTGLENLGNSCYLNSVYQALFSLEEFQEKYYQQGCHHLETCKKYAPDCFLCQFSKLGNGLCSGDFSIKKEEKIIENGEEKIDYYQDGIKIHNIKIMVGKGHMEFSSNRQQDANEFLSHLLSYLQKQEKQNNISESLKSFSFIQQTKLNCMSCGGYKIRESPSQELKLPCPYIKKENAEEEYPVNFEDLCKSFVEGELIEGVFCPKCNGKTNFVSRNSLKSFPKYLIVPVQRFIMDVLGPQKINAYINFSKDPLAPFDFNIFKPNKPLNNEFLIEDNNEADQGPQIDTNALDSIKMMGFGENRARRALMANKNNLDLAINWLFEKVDDFSLDEPLPKKIKIENNKIHISAENIENIMVMGFSEKQARFALGKSDNNVERAIDYLFSHPEEIEEEVVIADNSNSQNENYDLINPKYILQAAIVHLGKSVHCGHYVSYVRYNNEWIFFNDRKVAKSNDPLLGKAYILLFKRVE